MIGNPPRLPLQSTPPPGPRSGHAVRALVGVLVVVFVLLLGLFVYLAPPQGVNCTDWYVYCPTGPGATPLGVALDVGNGTGACPAGIGSSAADCAYSFSVKVDPLGNGSAPIPSARDLTFQLQSSASVRLNSTYLVTLISPNGSRLGIWNSSTSAWTAALTQAGSCRGSDCLSTPLSAGESLILQAIPAGGLPYSHQGDRLVCEAVGGGFTGWVDVPVN